MLAPGFGNPNTSQNPTAASMMRPEAKSCKLLETQNTFSYRNHVCMLLVISM